MPSFGLSLILLGMALVVLSQFAMAIYAFAVSPLKGIMCLVVPMYIVVHSKRSQTGKRLLATWYIGLGLLVTGGVISS
jgi:hypothetical protein